MQPLCNQSLGPLRPRLDLLLLELRIGALCTCKYKSWKCRCMVLMLGASLQPWACGLEYRAMRLAAACLQILWLSVMAPAAGMEALAAACGTYPASFPVLHDDVRLTVHSHCKKEPEIHSLHYVTSLPRQSSTSQTASGRLDLSRNVPQTDQKEPDRTCRAPRSDVCVMARCFPSTLHDCCSLTSSTRCWRIPVEKIPLSIRAEVPQEPWQRRRMSPR